MPSQTSRSNISRAPSPRGFAYQGEVFPLHDAPRGSRVHICRPRPPSSSPRTTTRSAIAHWGSGYQDWSASEKLKQALALVLLNPYVLMLFMGEEAAPTHLSCSLRIGPAKPRSLTREGRRREFAHFKAFSTAGDARPDSGPVRRADISGVEARLGGDRLRIREPRVSALTADLLENSAREDHSADRAGICFGQERVNWE